MQIKEYINKNIICACCGHKAKSGWLLTDNKVYAINCAGNILGILPSTLRKLTKQILKES